MYKKSISIIKTKKKIRNKKTQNKKKVYNKKTKYLLKGSGNNSIQRQLDLNILNTSSLTDAVNNEKIVSVELLNENILYTKNIDSTNEMQTFLDDFNMLGNKYKHIYIKAVDVSQPPPESKDKINGIQNNTKLDELQKKNSVDKIYEEYYQNKTTESYKNIFNEFYNYIKNNIDKTINIPQFTLNLIIVFFNSVGSVLDILREKIIIKAIYESFLKSDLPLIDPTYYSVNLNEMFSHYFEKLKEEQNKYLTQTSIEQITSINVTPTLTGTPKSICELLVLYKNKI
jgi:hypothetical protein